MDTAYRKSRSATYLINYHFIFCPRYRRKIFLIPGVEERFKQIVKNICNELDADIIAMKCDNDYTHLFLSAPPTVNPAEIVKRIKGATGKILLREIPQLSRMPHLWTRSYFVSTAGNVSSETIKLYVESQKKRY